ncbi:MAG: hypothetical protein H0X45_09360 [Planctomycetes bacterium]|nr:hypothetical protein [Planctomycetota bacterium]
MSENIVHTAVVDDCRRLILHGTGVGEAVRDAWTRHHELSRLGGITRSGDTCIPRILDRARQAHPQGALSEPHASRVAFALGWLAHRATDRQMKIVFRQAEPGQRLSPSACSVYHDVTALREVYAMGAEPYRSGIVSPGLDGHPAAALANDAVIDLFHALLQRSLIELHTLKPDEHDPESWIDALAKLRQRFRVELPRYAQALTHPDPELHQRFVVATRFYDAGDPLIALARALQHGTALPKVDLDQALAASANGSLYARAVARAYRSVSAADAFLRGTLDDEGFAERIDIGRPELAG